MTARRALDAGTAIRVAGPPQRALGRGLHQLRWIGRVGTAGYSTGRWRAFSGPSMDGGAPQMAGGPTGTVSRRR